MAKSAVDYNTLKVSGTGENARPPYGKPLQGYDYSPTGDGQKSVPGVVDTNAWREDRDLLYTADPAGVGLQKEPGPAHAKARRSARSAKRMAELLGGKL